MNLNFALFILSAMIFLHIIADFKLQGLLGNFKQKEWWEKNYPQEKYKKDYITCLIIHSFEWSFLIMLPLIIYYKYFNTGIFIMNIIIHSLIDHKKANKLKISLTKDQRLHLVQIITTFLVYLMMEGVIK